MRTLKTDIQICKMFAVVRKKGQIEKLSGAVVIGVGRRGISEKKVS